MKNTPLKRIALAFLPAASLACAPVHASQSSGHSPERVATPDWTRTFEVLPLGSVCAITRISRGARQHYEITEGQFILTPDRRFSLSVAAPSCRVTKQDTNVTCSYEQGGTTAPVCTRPRRIG